MSSKYISLKVFALIAALLLMNFSAVQAQVRIKTPKVTLQLGSAYDTNRLKAPESSDSIKVGVPAEQLGAGLYWRISWTKRIRTLVSAQGDYTFYPGKSNINEWDAGFKLKTTAKVYPKYKKSWIPGLYWDFGLKIGMKDKLYNSRELGEEFETTISGGEKLALGDLLDRKSIGWFSGARIKFNRYAEIYAGWRGAVNNYTDLGKSGTDSFHSLDNKENSFHTALEIKPLKQIKIELNFAKKYRQYDYKSAKNLKKQEIAAKNREYVYSTFGVQLDFEYVGLEAKIGFSGKNRDDRFEGYYNYKSGKFNIEAGYRFSSIFGITASYKAAQKDYDELSFSDVKLSNNYTDFTFSFPLKIMSGLTVEPMYIYDAEDSSYEKFSYQRHIGLIKASYRVW